MENFVVIRYIEMRKIMIYCISLSYISIINFYYYFYFKYVLKWRENLEIIKLFKISYKKVGFFINCVECLYL